MRPQPDLVLMDAISGELTRPGSVVDLKLQLVPLPFLSVAGHVIS